MIGAACATAASPSAHGEAVKSKQRLSVPFTSDSSGPCKVVAWQRGVLHSDLLLCAPRSPIHCRASSRRDQRDYVAGRNDVNAQFMAAVADCWLHSSQHAGLRLG